jgi:hypothetical protein
MTTLLASLLFAVAAAAPAPRADAAPAAKAPAPAAVQAPAVTPASLSAPAERPDPCDRLSALPEDPDCDGPLCTARERVELACQVREAMTRRYVFFPVKGKLLGRTFDAAAHLDACVAEERAIAREDDPLRFYDRMRRCTAAFEDGHLLLGAPVRLPQVALGLGLRLVGGKVVIANRERKLVSYLSAVSGVRDLDALLAAGNEVMEIDGRPASEAVAELARFIPASSGPARLERAVDALTRRDFAFPARRTAVLTVRVDGAPRVVELPWWISPDAEAHLMTRAYLRRSGLATTDLLTWRYDPGKDSWDREASAAHGALRSDPILPARDAAGLRSYQDDQDRLAVRLGEVVRRRDRAFCYAQILTFHTENLKSADGAQPFDDVLAGFVKGCREKGLDLVLDLRQNDGGYLAHTSALAAALTPKGRAAPAGALLLRASTLNQLVYQQRAPALGGVPARSGDDAFEPRRVVEAIGAARRSGAAYTPALLEAPIRASDFVGGYDGKIVALTSPACMSACDRLAGMLKASGRAVLVGGPTEGAGGSQQEARNLGARWTDSQGLLTLSIPNAAMGVLPRGGARVDAAPDAFFTKLALENRPVVPDVAYATTVKDLTGANAGWLARAEEALFGPAVAAR